MYRRQTALFFFYESEMCPQEHSTIRSNGVLHPDDDYLARALTVPLHRVSRCRLPAVWQLRSWLEAEGELHSTTMSSPTVTGPGRWVATTVHISTDARDARIGSLCRTVCMHAPTYGSTGWPSSLPPSNAGYHMALLETQAAHPDATILAYLDDTYYLQMPAAALACMRSGTAATPRALEG